MENRQEALSRENRLFMQNKAYWGNDSDRAYGRGGNVLSVLSRRGQDTFSLAEDVQAFLLGSCFFREGPGFSVRLCFSADFAEAEKPVRWFSFRQSGGPGSADFCLSEKGNFFDGKVRLFLDRKGMNLYTG